ncbi:hypothetical protein DERP_008559 [Dermatophagoides pteronyssinus]|uniref:Uncharacterized protein n=1 Tax=Dermatophagoides pteronyssinus TaxID=6956 RepID=A0ABQ8IWP0_DERPT|nr:hypothetical protein DERP_008559 [Dermatophagoides pteronyssinus]
MHSIGKICSKNKPEYTFYSFKIHFKFNSKSIDFYYRNWKYMGRGKYGVLSAQVEFTRCFFLLPFLFIIDPAIKIG